MCIVLAVCIFTYVLQRSHLKTEHHLESLVSRESSFLFNNLVLLTACFVILWGTLFPILSEYVEGSKVTVGAPFYNRVAVPIGLFLLFLTGVGPLLPWRATSLKAIKRNFVLPSIALWATVIVCLVAGANPWKGGAFDQGQLLCDRGICGVGGGADGDLVGVLARGCGDHAADGAQSVSRRSGC